MARNTKRLLANSLCELLSEKTLDQITIKDLTDNCGLNRQTFYYNFHSIYDLIAWIFEENGRQFLLIRPQYPSWCEAFAATIQETCSNRALTLNAYHSVNRIDLERYLIDRFRILVADFVQGKTASWQLTLQEDDAAFLVDAFCRWIVGIVFEWLDEDMAEESTRHMNRSLRLWEDNLERSLKAHAVRQN